MCVCSSRLFTVSHAVHAERDGPVQNCNSSFISRHLTLMRTHKLLMICFFFSLSSIYCPWHIIDFKFQMNCIIYSIFDSIELNFFGSFTNFECRYPGTPPVATVFSSGKPNAIGSPDANAFDSHLIQQRKGILFLFSNHVGWWEERAAGASFFHRRTRIQMSSHNPKTSKLMAQI